MASNPTSFGLKLKELRHHAGLTQPGLAEKAGMSKGGIADLEQGINKPSWETVQALAAALGVSCEAFQAPPSADAQPRGRGRPPKADTPTAPQRGTGPGKGKRTKGE